MKALVGPFDEKGFEDLGLFVFDEAVERESNSSEIELVVDEDAQSLGESQRPRVSDPMVLME